MRNQITLADVAKAAGVHSATVSRAMSEDTSSQVNSETFKRIRKIAKEMGYTANTVARGLRTRKSMTIGVVVPDLTNPIFPPIVRGIDDQLFPQGYSSLIVNTDGSEVKEEKLFQLLMERQVDGLIIATGHMANTTLVDYHARGLKVVMVNREATGEPYPSVIGDDSAGIALILSHLRDLGHKSIIYLVGPTGFSTSKIRSRAFTESCKNLSLRGKIFKTISYSVNSGEETMEKILAMGSPSFTAVVAGNDLVALGVYHSLRGRGLRIPEDISVVGFNNMAFAEDFSPPLTTVSAPHYDMGVEAARLLLQQISENQASAVKMTLPVTLIVRCSTGKVL
jgi:LacI family transcriptional regulator